MSCDECAENGAKTNPSVPTYQLEYMYFEKSFPDGNCEAEFDKVVGTNLRYKTYNGLKGVRKFGIVIDNDLSIGTVHGTTGDSEVIEYLKTLKNTSTQQYFNRLGEIFYIQVPESKYKFWKIDNQFILKNHPKFDDNISIHNFSH